MQELPHRSQGAAERALLVMNMTAHGSSPTVADALLSAAGDRGWALDLAQPESPEETDATVLQAVGAGYQRILCAGGDGTVNRIAAVLVGTDVPLAIIPTGTANVLARTLGIPLDPVQALGVALGGQARRMDVGIANERMFLLMVGLGFDAEVVSQHEPRMKELFGPLAYVTAGLQAFSRYKSSLFHLEVDGTPLSLPAWLIIVGNVRYYGHKIAVMPDALVDDGMLDVCLFAERNALDRITQVGAVFAGMHLKHPNVSYFRARRVRITADPPVQMQIDGDMAGTTPVEIVVSPRALSIVT